MRPSAPYRIKAWLPALALAAGAWSLNMSQVGQRLELAVLDAGFHLLRWAVAMAPQRTSPVVIVGVDEASVAASGKPLALMLDDFADLMDGLAVAHARAVGIDLVFPARSYDQLQPGASQRLVVALARLRQQMPVVLGGAGPQPVGAADASALYAAVAGDDGLASLQVPLDADGRLRRISPTPAMLAGGLVPLAWQLARQMAVPVRSGLVDFSRGGPYQYVPMHEVTALMRAHANAELSSRFGGKVVLVGTILPDVDRQQLPLPLLVGERTDSSAGVAFQAQAVASLLAGSVIASQPALGALAALLAALLVWPCRRQPITASVLAAGLALLAALASVSLLARGQYVTPVAVWLVLAGSVLLAWWRAYRHHRGEQRRVKSIFAGYVSPAILDTILSGALREHSQLAQLAFLFADIRGFTALCAIRSPDQVIALLNRYYAAITVPLHQYGGTIDKFSGDGIMVFFGAPLPSQNPCRNALFAAIGMLSALQRLNEELALEGQAPLRIGIGIAYGDAVLGNVGTPQRHDYTATGAATTLAAHIQQFSKEVAHDLLIELTAFERASVDAGLAAQFTFLSVELKKHGNLELAAYMPATPGPAVDLPHSVE